MSDWQKGDLALYINNRRDRRDPKADLLTIGHVYLVAAVGNRDTDGALVLAFREITVPGKPRTGYAYSAWRFVKVTPPVADEFDRETIELMNRAPVGEPV